VWKLWIKFTEQLNGGWHRRVALEEPRREERGRHRLLLERHLQPLAFFLHQTDGANGTP